MRILTAAFTTVVCVLALTLSGPGLADPVSDRIYPAPRARLLIEGLPAGARLIQVTTADGLRLESIVVPGRPGMPTLLSFHGNGSSAADSVRRFTPALSLGYGIVAAEYRGYSRNPGRPSEAGLAADADAFMAEARRMAPGGPIWIVGHSLGGGVALSLARRSPADLVITIGAFTRLRDMVPGVTRAVIPDAYRNVDAIPRLTTPYFLIHGTADDIVPASHGQALHRLAGDADRIGASFVVVGANHYPNSAVLTAILEAIRTRAPGAAPGPVAASTELRVLPFSRSGSMP